MHHALEIHEILSNVFHQISPPSTLKLRSGDSDRIEAISTLAALARTCLAFKEPALDLLWSDLSELSPLARCLPEASRRLSSEDMAVYSFNRSLTQDEWDILKSYTRRIRCMTNTNIGLDWESVKTFLNPPATDSLFPNLRTLHCEYTEKIMSLLRLPLPSLVNLLIWFENPNWFPNSLESFPNSSPNVKRLILRVRHPEYSFSQIQPNYISRWQKLSLVCCPQITMDMDDIVHLSRMSELTRLRFALNAALPSSDSLLVFSNLHELTLQSESLEPVSRLLSQIRLPAITEFTVDISSCPSRSDLTSFFVGVPTSNTGHTIERLRLRLDRFDDILRSGGFLLGLENLRPWIAFSNLRHMEFDIACNVDLTDSELLVLATAWPKLECLLINAEWGWNATGGRGITPGGVVQLLRTCRSLSRVTMCLDTRGYTEVSPSHVPESLGLTLSSGFSIDFLDSVIEAESVAAITTFVCGIATCSGTYFSIFAWGGLWMIDLQRDEYVELWDDVVHQVNDFLGRRSNSSD